MTQGQGRGWHGDPEGHAEVARNKTSWWPLLLVPLAFFIGWGANSAVENSDDQSRNFNAEQGVGGSSDVPYCITPPGNNTQ